MKTMSNDFYEKLKAIIKECEEHPYNTTQPVNFGDGWEYRVSKKDLGTWSDEEYDILFHHLDKEVDNICQESSLDCFVYCERGGRIYLAFK